jgi:hypothetical protein
MPTSSVKKLPVPPSAEVELAPVSGRCRASTLAEEGALLATPM